MEEIYRSRFLVVHREPRRKIIHARRTSVSTTPDEFMADLQEFVRVLPISARAGFLFYYDAREGPLISSDAHEQAMNSIAKAVLQGFKLHAILVGTAVGRLQVTRIGRLHGEPLLVFTDEAEALAYLRTYEAPASER